MYKINSSFISIAVFVLILIASPAFGNDDPLVVVVNDSCEFSDITFIELERLYLGKITALPDDSDVLLLVYTSVNEMFFDILLDMTVLEVRKHWIRLVLEGEFVTPPDNHYDHDEIKRVICRKKGAICVIPLSKVDECMKVVSVDGKTADDKDYVLK